MNKITRLLVLLSFLVSNCALIPETGQTATKPPEIGTAVTSPIILSAVPSLQLPADDQVIFTIPNPEPFSGREGEPRPNWLGWGAETFAVAPNGSFWIADTAVYPNRLLHYNRNGELLQEISLENMVVHAYDLLVTQDSLWVLDISTQQPRIIQLDMNGEIRSSINIPTGLMTNDGHIVGNGISNLFLGEEDELLLNSINGYYEMVDASGLITIYPLDVLHYYDHTYKIDIFDETTWRLPIFVDGTLLEGSLDFFVEVPFLGFNPDGSFALAGVSENAEHGVDYQVRYYSSSGELLGIARQQPQTFYKDWNHHLAVGPDGAVYQLLSNLDHSVQILRLGFAYQLSPLVQSVLTPTPLTVLQPFESPATDEERARNVLLAFFTDLSHGNYVEAAANYGGEKIEYGRELLPGETQDEYWAYICDTVLMCLPVADITNTEQVSENEFVFYVVFMHPDGTRFGVGACCGGDPAATPAVWQFAYTVQKIDGTWKVMRGPIFTP